MPVPAAGPSSQSDLHNRANYIEQTLGSISAARDHQQLPVHLADQPPRPGTD
jgi:hypothetical protein